MRDYKYVDWYKQDRVIKHLKIEYADGIPITCNELHEEEFELKEYLCSSEQLRFGSCEACSVKFRISNVIIPLKNKKLTVTETLDNNSDVSFQFGNYKVHSDKPTADRKYRDVVAYDAMYDILNAEVSAWFNSILPNADSTVTMKEFRCSFLDYFGIEYENVTLVNDDMIITKTIEPTTLSGKTVITAICEIDGCFGHIGRDGRFQYIHLEEMKEGVYPSDTLYPRDDLYPSDPMNVETVSKSHYISATYEDFTTARINKLQIRQEEDDIGYIYGTGNNCYIVQDNFLVYGKSSEELHDIAEKLYSVISKVWYCPAHVEAKGNPCLEVGDGIKLRTTYEIVYTYILQRTLKGIQALRDTYESTGEQYQQKKVNSPHEDIIQLKGKTNKLTRTLEETRLEIIDIEKGLSTRITQNAQSITLLAKQGEDMAAQISLNAQQILLRVSKGSIISEINQTAEKITISASKIDLEGLVEADEFKSRYAEIEELDVQTLRVTNLEANIENNYTKTKDLEADYATIYSVNSVSSRIDSLLNSRMQVIGYFGLGPTAVFTYHNKTIGLVTINGKEVLGVVDEE